MEDLRRTRLLAELVERDVPESLDLWPRLQARLASPTHARHVERDSKPISYRLRRGPLVAAPAAVILIAALISTWLLQTSSGSARAEAILNQAREAAQGGSAATM